ncbi:MAG: hypothetical protein E7495_11945 [Ruminococcus flavefaciens]|jgi:hypothetical protein|nr:hypothetical protein [Ruminococcus flavefaciens]
MSAVRRLIQMSKLNAFAAVLKFINGSNDSKEYLQGLCNYITDPAKTDNGNLVATQGCSKEHPLEDMLRNKLLHNKTNGKQGEHFVLALAPCGESKTPLEVLSVVKEIVATVYPENMAIIAGHTDSKYLHFHVALDAVNAVTGRKFSQSPADLNRVKQKANNILKKHGFEIITASANDFVDHSDYSNEVGFDFLELDESQFITESHLEKISAFTDSVSIEDTIESINSWDYDDCDTPNYFGGNYMNNNYTSCSPQTQAMPKSILTVDAVPSTLPAIMKEQESNVPTTTYESVPAACGTTNDYPNTNVATGPIFRIKGNKNSNFEGLKSLVEKTSADAYAQQRNAGNLALAMQQHGQLTGHPSNVTVYSEPIFEIDMNGRVGCDEQYEDIYD